MGERIQLRRTGGWRKPAGAVVVSRPSLWGNPWRVVPNNRLRGPGADWTIDGPGGFFIFTDIKTDAAAYAVHLYRRWLQQGGAATHLMVGDHTALLARRDQLLRKLPELAGRDLACWCPPGQACHADVLLELLKEAA